MGSNKKWKKKYYDYFRIGRFSLVIHNEHGIWTSRKLSRISLSGKGRKGLSGGRNSIRHGSMLCSGNSINFH